jgi:hypothetical protein
VDDDGSAGSRVNRWLQLLDPTAMKKPTGGVVPEEQAVIHGVEPNARRGGRPWLVQPAAIACCSKVGQPTLSFSTQGDHQRGRKEHMRMRGGGGTNAEEELGQGEVAAGCGGREGGW